MQGTLMQNNAEQLQQINMQCHFHHTEITDAKFDLCFFPLLFNIFIMNTVEILTVFTRVLMHSLIGLKQRGGNSINRLMRLSRG